MILLRREGNPSVQFVKVQKINPGFLMLINIDSLFLQRFLPACNWTISDIVFNIIFFCHFGFHSGRVRFMFYFLTILGSFEKNTDFCTP